VGWISIFPLFSGDLGGEVSGRKIRTAPKLAAGGKGGDGKAGIAVSAEAGCAANE